jgi:hypothetical protein
LALTVISVLSGLITALLTFILLILLLALVYLYFKRKVKHHRVLNPEGYKEGSLSWLTNSALVNEPKCRGRGGVAGSQPMSTDVSRSPNILWRSDSIFNL